MRRGSRASKEGYSRLKAQHRQRPRGGTGHVLQRVREEEHDPGLHVASAHGRAKMKLERQGEALIIFLKTMP
jgi:hypothetical protein